MIAALALAAAVPCMAPVVHHHHAKPVPAQSCAPPVMCFRDVAPDPDPLTAPTLVTRYEVMPAGAAPAAWFAPIESAWQPMLTGGGYAVSVTPVTPKPSVTTVNNVVNNYTTTDNTFTTDTTVTYNTPHTVIVSTSKPVHCPEMSGSGLIGSLTLLGGLIMVLNGKRV